MKNQVILNKDENTAKLIREYFESKGVDTSKIRIIGYDAHYGIINDKFNRWCSADIKEHNAEIIELPIKKDYPKVMWVWDDEKDVKLKRVVFMEKLGRYIAWNGVETIEQADKETCLCTWKHAKDIEEPKQITIQEAEKMINDLGNNVKIV